MRKWEMREPIAKLGDIVNVRGYGHRRFEVFSVNYEAAMDAVESFEEIFYDVVSVDLADFMIAWQEDVTVVETPNEIDYEKLEGHSAQSYYDIISSFTIDYNGLMGGNKPKEQITKKEEVGVPKNRSKSDKIDVLLDELYDYQTTINIVGDDHEEGDGYYRDKVDEIKAELAAMMGGVKE